MTPAPRPAEGQTITLLLLVGGAPRIISARVLHLGPHAVVVDTGDEAAEWTRGRRVTMLYAVAGDTWRWRATLGEHLPSGLYLETTAEPILGERREFVRCDVELQVIALPVAEGLDVDAARRVQLGSQSRPGDATFLNTHVDLSASGARLPLTHPARVGDLLDLRFGVPLSPPVVVHAIARVVRAAEQEPESVSIACNFEALSSTDQDLLLHFVFVTRRAELEARFA